MPSARATRNRRSVTTNRPTRPNLLVWRRTWVTVSGRPPPSTARLVRSDRTVDVSGQRERPAPPLPERSTGRRERSARCRDRSPTAPRRAASPGRRSERRSPAQEPKSLCWLRRCCSRSTRTALSTRWSPMTGSPALTTPKLATILGTCLRWARVKNSDPSCSMTGSLRSAARYRNPGARRIRRRLDGCTQHHRGRLGPRFRRRGQCHEIPTVAHTVATASAAAATRSDDTAPRARFARRIAITSSAFDLTAGRSGFSIRLPRRRLTGTRD